LAGGVQTGFWCFDFPRLQALHCDFLKLTAVISNSGDQWQSGPVTTLESKNFMSAAKKDDGPMTFPYQQYPDIVRDSSQMSSAYWSELSMGATKVLVVTDSDEELHLRDCLLTVSRIHVTDTVLRLSDASRALRGGNYDVVLIALNAHRSDLHALLNLMNLHQSKARAVVVLSPQAISELTQLYDSKVMGYISQEDVAKHLTVSIVEVADGGFTASPGFSRTILKLLEPPAGSVPHTQRLAFQNSSPSVDSGSKTLSFRELEVLKMVARGHVSVGIADSLGIATATVNAHMGSIFKKLNVKTRAQAIHTGSQLGLLKAD
jgi:DNA-binding NarL/FixJ family response regulator